MSFSAKSLFSQKKGTIYSLVLLIAVAAMVVGILSVSALNARTIKLTPEWTGTAAGFPNQTYNFTIAAAPAPLTNATSGLPSVVAGEVYGPIQLAASGGLRSLRPRRVRCGPRRDRAGE